MKMLKMLNRFDAQFCADDCGILTAVTNVGESVACVRVYVLEEPGAECPRVRLSFFDGEGGCLYTERFAHACAAVNWVDAVDADNYGTDDTDRALAERGAVLFMSTEAYSKLSRLLDDAWTESCRWWAKQKL